MRLFLTGGTGFIGSHLVAALVERGDECLVLSRSGHNPWSSDRVRVVPGDPVVPGAWQREVATADAVVNLAGARIVDPPHRWSEARKRVLRSSRIETTRNLVQAIRAAPTPPRALLSASAIGYYGPRGDDVVDESAPAGTDFLGRLAAEWEAAALEGGDATRVVLLRGGLALGHGGGVLQSLLPLFRSGMGGPWGAGTQWWSWIHVADQVALILFALEREITGPLNLTAPSPVTVNAFAAALGKALGRPAAVRAPEFALRLALGEAADSLLELQRVVPQRALEAGYLFRFPTLGAALDDLFGERRQP